MTETFLGLRWQDVIDILLITFIVYRLFVWLRGTRALRILMALVALGLFYVMARWIGLFITTWILQYLWAVILVIAVVVFQSEIRQMLERMSPLRFFLGRPESLSPLVLDELVRAVFELAQKKIGALIVFQRQDILGDQLKGGIPLDGRVSYEILSSIFLPNSPAHDGAVIVQEGRVISLGCYLPLSDSPDLPRNYGTRHRAGIGITERSDAVSLIVSEERGEILLAVEGRITRMAKPEDLKIRLESMLSRPEEKGRWHTHLTADLLPKSLSFILVLILWGFIGGQQRAEMRLTIPLEYRNIPAAMEIAGGAHRVEVGIRGSRGMISTLTSDQVRAFVDLAQVIPGQNYIRLNADNIQTPVGTELTQINPSTVRLTMEAIKTRPLPVKVRFTGKVAGSRRLKNFTVNPSTVLVQGPENALARVREILTEPLDLSQIQENKRISLGLEVDSPRLHLSPNQPSQVWVELELDRP